jgi:hypothetical protein
MPKPTRKRGTTWMLQRRMLDDREIAGYLW